MTTPPHEVQEMLLALRENYIEDLPDKVSAIDTLWDSLTQQWDPNTLGILYRHIHSLAGSGVTFGFTEISNAARELDAVLNQALNSNEVPGTQLRESIASKVGTLKQACNTARKDASPPSEALYSLPNTGKARDKNAILLINISGSDPAFDIEKLQQSNYQITTCDLSGSDSVAGVLQLIGQQSPAVLIYNIDDFNAANITLVETINRQLEMDIPTLFISKCAGMEPRLQAVRHGSDAYYMKPVDSATLLDKLDSYARNRNHDPYQVLIIDDSSSLANAYALFLELAGMKTLVVTDPMKVCDALCTFSPDLILLDMYMPNCSGPELAMVIRQQGTYTSVPIVFMSAQTDITGQHNAMRRGGDGFLAKPIKPEHLVNAVTIRASRHRELRACMSRDSLSGLLNHSTLVEQLQIEISRAERNQDHLAYVMIDIDDFKTINDSFGHAAGDQVIRTLARLLQQSVRNTDIVGRYGGDEFSIILYGTDEDLAFDVMENLRMDFEKIEHVFNDQPVKLTFSCGIAIYPQTKQIAALQQEADKALYLAKNQGNNRTVVAAPADEN